MARRVTAVPAMVLQVRPTVPRAVAQPPVLAMPAAGRAVPVRVVAVRVVTPMVAPHRTPSRQLPVVPGTAAPAGPRTAVLLVVGRPERVVMPIAGLAVPATAVLVVMPTAAPGVPVTPGPVGLPMPPRTVARLETLPAVLVLEPPGRAMQRVTPVAVRAVRRPRVPVVSAQAASRQVRRLRVEQDLPPATRTAVQADQRQAVSAGPAEQVMVVPVQRVRAVLLLVAQVVPAVTERAVPAVPVTPGPVVQPQPVMVVLVVTPLAVIPILPAVT